MGTTQREEKKKSQKKKPNKTKQKRMKTFLKISEKL